MRILAGVLTLLALALSALAAPPGPAPTPELALRPAGLVIRRLPPVLSEHVVARHLDTGLTTGFVFTVDGDRRQEARPRGAAQVRIRYDLWDERYVAERWDARPDSPAVSLLVRSELLAWWRALELVVGAGPPSLRAARAKVTLRVLPFSQAEQRDAQDWLLRSYQSAGRDPGQRAAPPAGESAPLRSLYGSMLASSIGQRSLISYEWAVAIAEEAP